MSNEQVPQALPTPDLTPRQPQPFRTPEAGENGMIPSTPNAPNRQRRDPEQTRPKRKRVPPPQRDLGSDEDDDTATSQKTTESEYLPPPYTDTDAGDQQVEVRHEHGAEEAVQQGQRKQARQPKALKKQVDNKYNIRRILAQKSSSTSQKEYLVDYYPTWEREAHLTKQKKALKIWETNREKGFTFEYASKHVGKQTVLKATNPTADDDPRLARQMLDTVVHELRKFLARRGLAVHLFLAKEWAFASKGEQQEAMAIAEVHGQATPNAAAVMQYTFKQMQQARQKRWSPTELFDEHAEDLLFGSIKVQYLGQIDDNIDAPARRSERNCATVTTCVRHMYAIMREDLDSMPSETPELEYKLGSLAGIVDLIVKKSPYLLKKKFVWPLFFIRFFIFSDDIELKLNPAPDAAEPDKKTQRYEMTEDWHEETRDWFLQAYSEKVFGRWDSRALEHIERTYIQCRDGVMRRVKEAPKLKAAGGQEVEGDWADEDDTDEGPDSPKIRASEAEDDMGDEGFVVDDDAEIEVEDDAAAELDEGIDEYDEEESSDEDDDEDED